jgi:ABC-type iron transport system FetAB ATPase subunit
MAKKTAGMTYEAYLDEVTTLITEKHDISDDDAIRLVMRAQAAEFFVAHDDDASMRTLDRAHEDARTVFKLRDTFP